MLVIYCAHYNLSDLHNISFILKKHNGKLYIFHMPLSSVQKKEYQTDLRIKEKEKYRQNIMNREGVIHLESHIDFKDEDFPDLWHLAKSKRKEFTKIVFKKWDESL